VVCHGKASLRETEKRRKGRHADWKDVLHRPEWRGPDMITKKNRRGLEPQEFDAIHSEDIDK
jgi:hypothetical protein